MMPKFYILMTWQKNCIEVEILEIALQGNMNFHTHIKKNCRKSGQKLSPLSRINRYLDQGNYAVLFYYAIQ